METLIIIGAVVIMAGLLIGYGYAVWPHKTTAGLDPVYDKDAVTWASKLPPELEIDEEIGRVHGTLKSEPVENTPAKGTPKASNLIPLHPKAEVKHIHSYPTDMFGQIKGPCAGCGKPKP